MPGNHGSSNRELIALPGCEEKETAESEWTDIFVRFLVWGREGGCLFNINHMN